MAKLVGKTTLPIFRKIQLCDPEDPGARSFATDTASHYRTYESQLNEDAELSSYSCNLFPIVTTASGGVWEPALLFFSHRIFDLGNCQIETHRNVADDLQHFKQFLDSKNLAYDNFDCPASHELPTYRYRSYLQNQISQGLLPISSARRRLQSVVAFYRYLIEKKIVLPANAPWKEKNVKLHIRDDKGFSRLRNVASTDLRIKFQVQQNHYSETIDDGGKLRPLSWNDQIVLIKNLMEWKNPEMAIIHLIAIFTGARIQTILTLKTTHFSTSPNALDDEFKLKVGPGTAIDTKGDKISFLNFPMWLFERILTYSASPRASKRRAKNINQDHDDYLLLTKYGRPYYDAKIDTQKFQNGKITRYNSNGQEVRKYKALLIKKINATTNGSIFHYRFHDLRATFGMNLTDAQMTLVQMGQITLAQAREYVRFRMGHSSYEITDRYLNHRKNIEHTRAVKDAYGSYLENLRNAALGITP